MNASTSATTDQENGEKEWLEQQEPKETSENNGRENISNRKEEILDEMQQAHSKGQAQAENAGAGHSKKKGGDILIFSPNFQLEEWRKKGKSILAVRA